MSIEHAKDLIYLAKRYGLLSAIEMTHRGESPRCSCWVCRRV